MDGSCKIETIDLEQNMDLYCVLGEIPSNATSARFTLGLLKKKCRGLIHFCFHSCIFYSDNKFLVISSDKYSQSVSNGGRLPKYVSAGEVVVE